MNFQVPQFIEVEDKIFGPFTFKQFVYLAGSAGAAFLIWVYIPVRFVALIFVIPVLILGLLLTFYRVNNRPFVSILEAAARYALTHKLYIWQRSSAPTKTNVTAPTTSGLKIPKLSDSKLKDLSWSLDVKEKIQ